MKSLVCLDRWRLIRGLGNHLSPLIFGSSRHSSIVGLEGDRLGRMLCFPWGHSQLDWRRGRQAFGVYSIERVTSPIPRFVFHPIWVCFLSVRTLSGLWSSLLGRLRMLLWLQNPSCSSRGQLLLLCQSSVLYRSLRLQCSIDLHNTRTLNTYCCLILSHRVLSITYLVRFQPIHVFDQTSIWFHHLGSWELSSDYH